jgi:hypothetical protein
MRNLAGEAKFKAKKDALAKELRQRGGGKDLHKPYSEGPHAYRRQSEPVHTPASAGF